MKRDRAQSVFSALADSTRRDVLQRVSSLGTATATELAEEMPVSRQAVVKHLSALNAAGLVARERSGREVRYRVTPAPMEEAVEWMTAVGARWDDRLARLRAQFD
jgi:DNA-binding transcriptional ArsR family regulator